MNILINDQASINIEDCVENFINGNQNLEFRTNDDSANALLIYKEIVALGDINNIKVLEEEEVLAEYVAPISFTSVSRFINNSDNIFNTNISFRKKIK